MDSFERELFLYQPALILERLISRSLFGLLTTLCFVAILGLGVWFGVHYILYSVFSTTIIGATLIVTTLYAILLMLRFFMNSFYFRGFHSLISGTEPTARLTYEVARIITDSQTDIAISFTARAQGYILLRRLGLHDTDMRTWLESERPRLGYRDLSLPPTGCITFSHLATALFRKDAIIQQRIKEQGITEEVFEQTVNWVSREYYSYKQSLRWWARDNLTQYGRIGDTWTYGLSDVLKRFSRPLTSNSVFSTLILDDAYATDKVVEIESILSREREGHTLIIGKTGVGKMDILARIGERIRRKETTVLLHDYQFITIDSERLLANFDSNIELERACITIFDQAVRAGNVIMLIDNLPNMMRSASAVSVDVLGIIENYLNIPSLHFVFTCDPQSYHQILEPTALMRRVQTVLIEPPTLIGVERVLTTIARSYEKRHGIIFTYDALRTIAQDADRFIPSGTMPDKAIDLLGEVASAGQTAQIATITAEFVDNFVHHKTGVPIGTIDEAERDTLLNLEDKLHERVIGQDAAIAAISKALRRARAGVQTAERPLGSFLFLGPTGVGKTETAKALAYIFFGAETAMLRFDMSEYAHEGAVTQLIGESGRSGQLASAMREHPHALILLDEFEKADQSVHDLFLQILDEGQFTDGRGETVNMRTTIIIATSNAGSADIMNAVNNELPLSKLSDTIVQSIISDGIYRPELINRFDGTIVFEPLQMNEQQRVAKLLLADVSARMSEKGYTITFADDVTSLVATEGYQPEFGARPMRRYIQDTIEEYIATAIIAGSLPKGSTLTICAADLTG